MSTCQDSRRRALGTGIVDQSEDRGEEGVHAIVASPISFVCDFPLNLYALNELRMNEAEEGATTDRFSFSIWPVRIRP